MFSVCWFPWCKYSHYGLFPATNMVPLVMGSWEEMCTVCSCGLVQARPSAAWHWLEEDRQVAFWVGGVVVLPRKWQAWCTEACEFSHLWRIHQAFELVDFELMKAGNAHCPEGHARQKLWMCPESNRQGRLSQRAESRSHTVTERGFAHRDHSPGFFLPCLSRKFSQLLLSRKSSGRWASIFQVLPTFFFSKRLFVCLFYCGYAFVVVVVLLGSTECVAARKDGDVQIAYWFVSHWSTRSPPQTWCRSLCVT